MREACCVKRVAVAVQVNIQNEPKTALGFVIASEAKQSPRCSGSQRWRLLRHGVYPEPACPEPRRRVEGFLAMTPSECLRVACGLFQTAGLPLSIRGRRGQLKEAAQAEASPIRAGDSRKGQDEENDQDDHPTAAARAGTTAPEAEALLQPIEGSG